MALQSGYKADTFGYYRVVFTKAQVVDLVGNVKVTHCKGHQVMHVHVGMLEAPPWGKVKVSSHLSGSRGQHNNDDSRIISAHNHQKQAAEQLVATYTRYFQLATNATALCCL